MQTTLPGNTKDTSCLSNWQSYYASRRSRTRDTVKLHDCVYVPGVSIPAIAIAKHQGYANTL